MNITCTVRKALAVKEHTRATSALLVLGIKMTRKQVSLMDRDWLLYDIRKAHKDRMKLCHPDVGGCVTDAQALNVAKRDLERILAGRHRRRI